MNGTIQKTSPSLRLNRILSLAGVVSRRGADELILSGRVQVNGIRVVRYGVKAQWGKDSIRVDGREIPGPSQRLYLMLNKPFGYVCTLKDPEGRPIVTDLLQDVTTRVYPVGRLDFDSLGLLLLTNDGEWAHRISHPRFHVPKTYKLTVRGAITDEALHTLGKGIPLEDGFSGSSKATLVHKDPSKSVIRITITSGKKRIIRRLAEALGYNVIQLMRTGYGPLELGNLKIGSYRYLEQAEVELLKK